MLHFFLFSLDGAFSSDGKKMIFIPLLTDIYCSNRELVFPTSQCAIFHQIFPNFSEGRDKGWYAVVKEMGPDSAQGKIRSNLTGLRSELRVREMGLALRTLRPFRLVNFGAKGPAFRTEIRDSGAWENSEQTGSQ